mmetsp:Transcript_16492/g.40823  ORF Transcript_16492/g.40823 Transcript_16492/m.40823 type:complete len:266 (+) Transcript_16492:988-1785(+)
MMRSVCCQRDGAPPGTSYGRSPQFQLLSSGSPAVAVLRWAIALFRLDGARKPRAGAVAVVYEEATSSSGRAAPASSVVSATPVNIPGLPVALAPSRSSSTSTSLADWACTCSSPETNRSPTPGSACSCKLVVVACNSRSSIGPCGAIPCLDPFSLPTSSPPAPPPAGSRYCGVVGAAAASSEEACPAGFGLSGVNPVCGRSLTIPSVVQKRCISAFMTWSSTTVFCARAKWEKYGCGSSFTRKYSVVYRCFSHSKARRDATSRTR